MIDIEEFHVWINDEIPDIFPDLLNRRIIDTLVHYCEQTRLWTYEMDPVDAVAGERVVDIDTPTGSRVAGIDVVRFSGMPLVPTSIRMLNDNVRNWDSRNLAPKYYIFSLEEDEILLVGAPQKDESGAIKISLSLKPVRNATEVPNFFLDDEREAIVSGTLARIFSIKNKRYYDQDRANANAFVYNKAVAEGKIRRNTGDVPATLKATGKPIVSKQARNQHRDYF
jgi:hypothetical protein